MREVAKSMLGFSWAVSLFSVQQLANLVTPSAGPYDPTASKFDEATRAMQSLMTDTVAQQFRAGDEWQRRVVDALFDAAALQNVDPRRVVETLDPRAMIESMDARRLVQTGVDYARQSFDVVRTTVTGVPAAPAATIQTGSV